MKSRISFLSASLPFSCPAGVAVWNALRASAYGEGAAFKFRRDKRDSAGEVGGEEGGGADDELHTTADFDFEDGDGGVDDLEGAGLPGEL